MPEKKQTTRFREARSVCIRRFKPFTKEFGVCMREQLAGSPKPGTPEGYRAGLWGQKIRSKGMGRGLGIGKGEGPIGRVKRYA